MEINWYIVIPVVIFALLLLFFVTKRNLKDEKQLEKFLNKKEMPLEEDEEEANNIQ